MYTFSLVSGIGCTPFLSCAMNAVTRDSFRKRLDCRMTMGEVRRMCLDTHGVENDGLKEMLFSFVGDDSEKVAVNALWCFTHFSTEDNEWLYGKHDALIDMVLCETNVSKRRLTLNLLLRQPFDEETLRTDFLDFCLKKSLSAVEPSGVRALCLKLAYEQCVFYDELMGELLQVLELLASQPMSPGVRSAYEQLKRKMRK